MGVPNLDGEPTPGEPPQKKNNTAGGSRRALVDVSGIGGGGHGIGALRGCNTDWGDDAQPVRVHAETALRIP